jgi:hypothetical protein
MLLSLDTALTISCQRDTLTQPSIHAAGAITCYVPGNIPTTMRTTCISTAACHACITCYVGHTLLHDSCHDVVLSCGGAHFPPQPQTR